MSYVLGAEENEVRGHIFKRTFSKILLKVKPRVIKPPTFIALDHNNIEETILNTFRKLKSSFIFNVM